MDKKENFNIIDFGSSKIRFTVFDKDLNNRYIDTVEIKLTDNFSSQLTNVQKLIKQAEKKNSSHIENIILLFDTPDVFTIDVSLNKTFSNKIDLKKIYSLTILELKQIINTNYQNQEIIHIIQNRFLVDENEYDQIPKNKFKVNNLKVEFKIICFPKKIISNLNKSFNEIGIKIEKIFCTSFIKSQSYFNKIGKNKISFLEIGLKRSTLIIYEKKKLKLIQSIPIGGSHITSDISKIFKITPEEAESIKISFSKSDIEFSYKNESNINSVSTDDILKKNISIDLLKKVILYRIQEIVDLIFKKSKNLINNIHAKDSELLLIGDGSILFNNNSFYLNDKFMFKSIDFYKETNLEICNSCLVYHLNNYEIPEILEKKQGIFEKFFNFFSK